MKLLEAIEDIVQKIEIKSDFSIHHPDYKPLELPIELVERLEKMSISISQKYLILQLRNFLYSTYYNSSIKKISLINIKKDNSHLNLENDTFTGINVNFYNRLNENNYGQGYFDPGWIILGQALDNSLIVTKNNFKIHIQRNKHLKFLEKKSKIGDIVSILLPKNRVQKGFYMAVGNEGFNHYYDKSSEQIDLRIYFNLIPEGAITIMKLLTLRLNNLAIPFGFKVLYNPKDYGRRDSGVLFFNKKNYETVNKVVKNIYKQNEVYFHSEVPLFTMKLAPGLALAEEPKQKFSQRESFGMNRCHILASGLLKAWYKGDKSIDGKKQAIYEEFSTIGINLSEAYLNIGSKNIYKPL